MKETDAALRNAIGHGDIENVKASGRGRRYGIAHNECVAFDGEQIRPTRGGGDAASEGREHGGARHAWLDCADECQRIQSWRGGENAAEQGRKR